MKKCIYFCDSDTEVINKIFKKGFNSSGYITKLIKDDLAKEQELKAVIDYDKVRDIITEVLEEKLSTIEVLGHNPTPKKELVNKSSINSILNL